MEKAKDFDKSGLGGEQADGDDLGWREENWRRSVQREKPVLATTTGEVKKMASSCVRRRSATETLDSTWHQQDWVNQVTSVKSR